MEELVFQYSMHKKLWEAMAKDPTRIKHKLLKDLFTKEEIEWYFSINTCAACTYVYNKLSLEEDDNVFCNYEECCKHCPLDFLEYHEDDGEFTCLNGLYNHFTNMQDEIDDMIYDMQEECIGSDEDEMSYAALELQEHIENKIKEASEVALQIANLGVKEGVKYE